MIKAEQQTESLDKLFLEISQFTNAKTGRELFLENQIREIASSKSWEEQGCMAEIALAEIEGREPDEFVLDYLDRH